MPVQCTYILVLLSTVFLYSSMAHPFARKRQEMRASWCESCGNEEECERCKYGPVYSSFCGGYVCGKGPGEKCGGPDDSIWGECGDGLSCSCNICTGCSLTTYDCLPDMCPPQEKPRPPHITFDIQLYSPSELK